MGTFIYDFVVVTAAPGLLWFRPKKIYETPAAKKIPQGGVLMICNHASVFDPLYLMLCIYQRRHHYVCTDDLLTSKFNKWLFKQFLTIPIDRENFGMSSFREITSNLKKGNLCVIFPEGHVVKNTKNNGGPEAEDKKKLENSAPMMDNLKSGMIMMAFSSGAPVWPVYLKPRRNIFERLRIVIGEPIDVKGLLGNMPTMDRINEVTKLITDKENYLKTLC
ncbi:MAG: 1-acyl-sn-glycerol-3-phosphate acyltransferase [Clostridia bacterium]|nr:1-acyl-sn-glycerol-3-phosphate acyltransferase [Clostridia bacterium]